MTVSKGIGSGRWGPRRIVNGIRLCSSCDAVATYTDGGGRYCKLCRRARQMVSSARQRYPFLPKFHVTRAIVRELLVASKMVCPLCHRLMIIGAIGRITSTTVTLQHWTDSQLQIICFGCNASDGSLERWWNS